MHKRRASREKERAVWQEVSRLIAKYDSVKKFLPQFNEIAKAIGELQAKGTRFEKLCNAYLKARFPNLVPRGLDTELDTTTAATPDAYFWDENGNLVACQYGSGGNWQDKLREDAKSVVKWASEKQVPVSKLIFCTTAKDDPALFKRAQEREEKKHKFSVEIYGRNAMAYNIEHDYLGIAARQLELKIELDYFDTLDSHLDSPGKRWPKRADIESGKVYYPEDHLARVEEALLKHKRCLITGNSASGKTGLAIAFGLRWGMSLEKHPEAIVFYTEALPGFSYERGEEWLKQICSHDYQNELFVIDNCHLAPEAVSRFVELWQGNRPKNALVLLVARPGREETPEEVTQEDDYDDFYSRFTKDQDQVDLKAEDLYTGVIQTYSKSYQRQGGGRYVPVEEDLHDPEKAELLRERCSHNLAVTQSFLEEWKEQGGRLSDVSEDKALDRLESLYLKHDQAKLVADLCALAQFEIPAHNSFIESNASYPKQLEVLQQEYLLTDYATKAYGLCYRLEMHAETTAQVFRAYIRRNKGSKYADLVETELIATLKRYLSVRPENFIEVYQQLCRNKAFVISNALLKDTGLQECAVEQFKTRSLSDVSVYLNRMFLGGFRETASKLLSEFLERLSPVEIERKSDEVKLDKFGVISRLCNVNAKAAKDLFGNRPVEWFSSRIVYSQVSIQAITRMLEDCDTSIFSQWGYDKDWQQEFVRAFDIIALASRARDINPHHAYWFIHRIKKLDKGQAKTFIETYVQTLLKNYEELEQKIPLNNTSLAASIFRLLHKLKCDIELQRRLARALNIAELTKEGRIGSIHDFFILMKRFKRAAPELPIIILNEIGAEKLAQIFRDKQAKVMTLLDLLEACSRQFWETFVKELSWEEVGNIFDRSKLNSIGILLRHYYDTFSIFYKEYSRQRLAQRISESSIYDIRGLVNNLNEIPLEGKRLVGEVERLLTQNEE